MGVNLNLTNATWVDVNTQFGINTKPELLVDTDAINNSLYNLFYCPIGTRPFLREYGSYLPFLLMEPIDNITQNKIYQSLLQSVRRWEPRIIVDTQKTQVSVLDTRDGYYIAFYYRVVNINKQGQFSLIAQPL